MDSPVVPATQASGRRNVPWQGAHMIRRPDLVARFEAELARREPLDHRRNLALFEALFLEARTLGVLPGVDPLEGLDVDIRLARALNVRIPS